MLFGHCPARSGPALRRGRGRAGAAEHLRYSLSLATRRDAERHAKLYPESPLLEMAESAGDTRATTQGGSCRGAESGRNDDDAVPRDLGGEDGGEEAGWPGQSERRGRRQRPRQRSRHRTPEVGVCVAQLASSVCFTRMPLSPPPASISRTRRLLRTKYGVPRTYSYILVHAVLWAGPGRPLARSRMRARVGRSGGPSRANKVR